MGWARVIALGLAIGSSIANGAASNANASDAIKAQIADLERQKEQLSADHANAEELYAFNVKKTNAALEDANRLLDNQIQDITDTRGRELGQNTFAIAAQDSLDSLSLASLQVQNAQEEGKALNTISATGTRMVGSGANLLRNQQIANMLEERQATGSQALARYKSYSAAKNTYIEKSQAIEGKEIEKVAAANATARILEEYGIRRRQENEQYQRMMGYIESNIRSLRKKKDKLSTPFTWEWLGSYAGTGMEIASSSIDYYINYKNYVGSPSPDASAATGA